MSYSKAQLAIINDNHHTLLVTAPAGSGKTHVLVGYAKARPEKKILYLAYNRAIKLEAEKKFPAENTDVMTFHGLAFQYFGSPFAQQKRLASSLRRNQIVAILKSNACGARDVNHLAQLLVRTIGAFCISSSPGISATHVPSEGRGAWKTKDVVNWATVVWRNLVRSDCTASIDHDVYVKLFHLAVVHRKVASRWDIVLFDEAQDASEVMADTVNRLFSHRAIIGDVAQKIYGYRGTVNVLTPESELAAKGYSQRHLTQSYRFGPKVGAAASHLLSLFYPNAQPVRGLPSRNTKISADEFNFLTRSQISEENVRQVYVIGRSLFGLARKAGDLVDMNVSYEFLGGTDRYAFKDYLSISTLFRHKGRALPDNYYPSERIAGFKNWDHLVAASRTDEQLGRMIETLTGGNIDDREPDKIANSVKYMTGMLLKAMKGDFSAEKSGNMGPHVVLTTAHRAKGLTCRDVVIAGDFGDVSKLFRRYQSGDWDGASEEEVNLLYVALTRATNSVTLPESLYGDIVLEQVAGELTAAE